MNTCSSLFKPSSSLNLPTPGAAEEQLLKMSIQDRLAAQDALQVLTVAAGLSLATAASTVGTKYNFPLMVRLLSSLAQ